MGQPQSLVTRSLFQLKVLGHTARRGLQNLFHPVPRYTPSSISDIQGHREELISALYADSRPEELDYELGKVHNLRQAVHAFHGIKLPAGAVFSFWRQLGPATRGRGFVSGRMLQLGCVVPAVGGGLCQISNALYELALRTGCEILERHPHSHRVSDGPALDATVAFNYVDLRFRTRTPIRIELQLTSTSLIAAFVCESLPASSLPELPLVPVPVPPHLRRTCATCNESGCTRHERALPPAARARSSHATAYLVDALWPEFDLYLQKTRSENDWLFLPLHGHFARRVHLPQYAWSTKGFAHVSTEPLQTILRSIKMRRLSSQGAARQTELLRTSSVAARAMVARLPYTVSHLVIDQTLLPAVWQSGSLGGRTFDVLLLRLPMHMLHQRLDQVAALWPSSPTAADFRAPTATVEAEQEALAAARHLITPHRELASIFADRAIKLDWHFPDDSIPQPWALQTDHQIPRFFFPGPTAARKGAYVAREAFECLECEVLWRGPELEGPNFWRSIPNRRLVGSNHHACSNFPTSITAVVQPSYLEEQPRLLLRCLNSGIPVITTVHAGLDPHPKLHLIDNRDPQSLRTLLQGLGQ